MSESGKTVTREELENEIIKKAQSDKDFKKALVDTPKEALVKLGVQVSEEIEFKVVEESAKVVYLVLPVNPEVKNDLGDCNPYIHGGCAVVCESLGPCTELCGVHG